jgi:hypothetical protein
MFDTKSCKCESCPKWICALQFVCRARLQMEFSRAGKEVAAGNIYMTFRNEYLEMRSPYAYHVRQIMEDTAHSATVQVCTAIARGNGSAARRRD